MIALRVRRRDVFLVLRTAMLLIAVFVVYAILTPIHTDATENVSETKKTQKRGRLGAAGKVVNRFCFLDAVGARTPGGSYHYVYPLVTWDDEPAWDSFTVIRRFEVVGESYSGDGAVVTVRYFVKCNLVNTETMQCDRVEKAVLTKFKLVRKKGVWRISDMVSWSESRPHVFEGVVTGYHGMR